MTAPRPDVTPERTAAEWFGLRRSGAMSADEAREFEGWLAADPEHRAAYDNLEHYWQIAAATRDDPEVLAMRDAAARTWRGRRLAVFGGAMVAALAVAVMAGVSSYMPGASDRLADVLAPGQQSFHTAVGQTQTVMLPDGSAVTLDTDTRIRARIDGAERRIVLERGRAFFRVAHDRSRPFRVLAAGRTVTALGTVFEVDADPQHFQVTLLEGRVRVEAPSKILADRPQTAELTPGSQLVASEDKRWSVSEADVKRETSWIDGRLAFDNDPLGQVVEEMNRYSDKKIVIRDASVARAPVLGVFKAGDVDGFVRAVEAYHLATVSRDDDREVELTAPS
jgi:transmembrane sensor